MGCFRIAQQTLQKCLPGSWCESACKTIFGEAALLHVILLLPVAAAPRQCRANATGKAAADNRSSHADYMGDPNIAMDS